MYVQKDLVENFHGNLVLVQVYKRYGHRKNIKEKKLHIEFRMLMFCPFLEASSGKKKFIFILCLEKKISKQTLGGTRYIF